MSEFEKMMLQQGVRKIGAASADNQDKPSEPKILIVSGTPPSSEKLRQDMTEDDSNVHWKAGKKAKEILANALNLAREDRKTGYQTWMTAMRQNGRATWINERDSAEQILARADRENLRVILIGGKGWTCILHPKMGIATIEMDP